MKIKHEDLIPNPENPFALCKLEREPYARVLTQIVSTYADGFVLAINNEWGTGKSTFVKMWQQQLKNNGYQTIYFNAWENDFDNKPLVAIMSEFSAIIPKGENRLFKNVVEKAAVFIKNVAPSLIKGIVSKHIDSEIVELAIENTAKSTAEILENEIKEYAKRKKTIIEFRIELEKFIASTNGIKPLVFIVDEIDRCRPNYAVEVLEQIKHFFSVKGIVFVLSIDKIQLANAVKGVYGSENINGEEYLRRFIDLEYSIPKPSTKDFVNYLYDYFSFNDFFSQDVRNYDGALRSETSKFILMADFLLSKKNITLRQQERMFATTRLILCSFPNNAYVFPELLFLLVYIKSINNILYVKIQNNDLSLSELSKEYGKIMESEQNNIDRRYLISIEALLIWFYNNNRGNEKINLNEKDENGQLKFSVNSKFAPIGLGFAENFEHILRQRYDRLALDYLIKKINLTEAIILE